MKQILINISMALIFILSACSLLPLQGTQNANEASEKPAEAVVEIADDELEAASLAPNPELSPDQVVQIQLEALQNNTSADDGIEIVFRFASPANKRTTGPLTRFIAMIKGPAYQPMLNHLSVEFDPVEISGDQAKQRVTLVAASGNEIVYVFFLSKQTGGACAGCWMTDAVIVESVRPGRTA